ncbi:MAG: uracil phosphoribosyltransferase [Planctomycetota bacterium]|jgi:uracil phosphoribosyltransferase|nr:uracil phosphoribosyltransferase [Planctomycetota bacterium]
MEVNLLNHPIVAELLTRLRDQNTPPLEFRRIVRQLTVFLGIEATADLPIVPRQVQTPLTTFDGSAIDASTCIVPILRAGLGMAEPLFELLPYAEVKHLGLFRDEETLQPVSYYEKLGTNPADICLLTDPMLATGGTAIAAVDTLKAWGTKDIRFLAILAAPEGVKALRQAHPEVKIHLAGLDQHLNKDGYIVPGLGDAGDRQYNTL